MRRKQPKTAARRAMDRGRDSMMAAGLGIAGTIVARQLWRASRRADLTGASVVITGGSRGLGLALAEEFARQGARITICARDVHELERAQKRIASHGAEVLAVPCDVADREQVDYLIQQATWRFGRVDVLVNNAGEARVGPLSALSLEDFESSMGTMFWGAVYPTLAVLPQMRERGAGRIATITSIGGKISAPHMLPYSAAKFAAVAFSDGLRAELSRAGIAVTTVIPGFLRTGSHVKAIVKGHPTAEFAWFSFGASMPIISMNARRAARRIVDGIRVGEAEVMLTPETKIAVRISSLFPSFTVRALSVMNRLLPSAPVDGGETSVGADAATKVTRAYTVLGERAAREYLQYNGGKEKSQA